MIFYSKCSTCVNEFIFSAWIRNYDDIPDNIFGRSRESSLKVRQRYELLFELIQKSGLRISEALGLKVNHIRVVDGVAKYVRVIGKGKCRFRKPLAGCWR
jgi:site-specific recombinase XerC